LSVQLYRLEGKNVPLQFETVFMDNVNSLLLRVPILNSELLNFKKGIISTPRNTPSVNWMFGDAATYTGAADNKHIYGYASKIGVDSFAFPIGDGLRLRKAAIAPTTARAGFRAAYFKGNPSTATLPFSAPFPITQLNTGLLGVSSYEFWDIAGTSETRVTLTWNTQSQLVALTQNDISSLVVAGWDGSKWVSLGTTNTMGDLATQGIITSEAVIPDNYKAFTFGKIQSQCISTAPLLSLGDDLILCPNDSVKLALNNYVRYEWQDGSVDSSFTVKEAGQYWVKTFDNCGNSQTDTLEIGEGGGVIVETLPTLCAGDKNGAIFLSDTTGVSIKLNSFTRFASEIEALPIGIYDLTVITPDGCQMDTLVEITQENINTIDIGRDTVTIHLGDTLNLDIHASFIPDSVKWNPGKYLSCSTCNSTIAKPTTTLRYAVEAWDTLGCLHKDEVKVFVNNKTELYIPTAFNPEKEFFTILGGSNVVSVVTMRIFDRWGTLLFEASNFKPDGGVGWDGYYKNQAMMRGTYVVGLEIQFVNGDIKQFASEFLLSR
jgi:gliding motility-associated-like protein